MRWIKYIFKLIQYLLIQFIFLLTRIIAKFGIATEFYKDLEISRDLGACSRLYKQKKYEECLKIYNQYKDSNNKSFNGIKYIMASMYYYGHGVKLNRKKSLELFDELASSGDINAITFMKQFKVRTHEKT